MNKGRVNGETNRNILSNDLEALQTMLIEKNNPHHQTELTNNVEVVLPLNPEPKLYTTLKLF